VEEKIPRTIGLVSVESSCIKDNGSDEASDSVLFDTSGMLQRMIASVDVTANDSECQDTDIVTTSFASGRT
jgi:hypothetical protein